MTVLAGMDAPAIDAPWARELCGGEMRTEPALFFCHGNE